MKTNPTLLALLTAAAFAGSSWTAKAVPSVSLNVLDPSITVGETFAVEIWVNGSAIGEDLLAFGFDVDPGTTLNNITYTGFTTGPLWSGLSGSATPPVVGDTAFPGITADNVLLATLAFTANTVGSDVLDIQGTYDGLFYGLWYQASSFDIAASTTISVNSQGVPDTSSLLVTAATLLGICISRYRFRR